MLLLHTADLHLKVKEDLSALEAVIKTAIEKKCGAILIAGDTFDEDNSNLSTEQALPQILQEFDGEILIIPGNHDAEFLAGRKSLSRNSIVLNGKEMVQYRKIGSADLCAIPFRSGISMRDIGEITCDPDNSILLAHGNFYTSDFFYDETVKKYFPIFEEDLRDRFRYAALGHYHRHFRYELGRTLVVNPGSPRITRSSDTGPRLVSVLNTDNWKAEEIVLPVPYLFSAEINVNVFDREEDIIAKVKTALKVIPYPQLAVLTANIMGTLSSKIEAAALHEIICQTARETTLKDCAADMRELKLIDGRLTENPFVSQLLTEIENSNPEEADAIKLFALERIQSIIK